MSGDACRNTSWPRCVARQAVASEDPDSRTQVATMRSWAASYRPIQVANEPVAGQATMNATTAEPSASWGPCCPRSGWEVRVVPTAEVYVPDSAPSGSAHRPIHEPSSFTQAPPSGPGRGAERRDAGERTGDGTVVTLPDDAMEGCALAAASGCGGSVPSGRTPFGTAARASPAPHRSIRNARMAVARAALRSCAVEPVPFAGPLASSRCTGTAGHRAPSPGGPAEPVRSRLFHRPLAAGWREGSKVTESRVTDSQSPNPPSSDPQAPPMTGVQRP